MERRAKERYRVWFPVTIRTASGEQGTAITYDVSSTGLSMACPGRLEVGENVTLRFKITGDEPDEREVSAKIVRAEPGEDEEGPWRFRMAVEFDAAHPELEGLLRENADEPGD